jgi:hypothetical protein
VSVVVELTAGLRVAVVAAVDRRPAARGRREVGMARGAFFWLVDTFGSCRVVSLSGRVMDSRASGFRRKSISLKAVERAAGANEFCRGLGGLARELWEARHARVRGRLIGGVGCV